jgi:hypothetical protein
MHAAEVVNHLWIIYQQTWRITPMFFFSFVVVCLCPFRVTNFSKRMEFFMVGLAFLEDMILLHVKKWNILVQD